MLSVCPKAATITQGSLITMSIVLSHQELAKILLSTLVRHSWYLQIAA